MDARLSGLYDLVRPGRGLIDVGTDHGYLPVRLALGGYPGNLFASDLREGPLQAARRSAGETGVSGRIRFLLSDGLDDCPRDEVDTIVIAGMGGDLICSILDRAEWCWDPAYRLLLQPMTKPEVLRYWLSNNGFRIEEDLLTEDSGTIYQIMAAVFCGQNERLSDAELYLGKTSASPLYQRLLEKELGRVERRIAGLEASGSPKSAGQLGWLRERKDELLSLREQKNGKS